MMNGCGHGAKDLVRSVEVEGKVLPRLVEGVDGEAEVWKDLDPLQRRIMEEDGGQGKYIIFSLIKTITDTG